jgi:acyl-coenzyme A synthetase/AMP-(fatty) acid ligase
MEYYHLDVAFTSGFMIDSWMRRTDIGENAFSSLKMVSCGGSYLSTDKLKRYTEFFRQHGYKGGIIRGYGMSELGGQQLSVPMESGDDILGYPVPKENYRIQDENDGAFYRVDDGPRTGVMYATSESMCLNKLDGEELFPLTEIDGRDFICSNDLVRLNEDGSFSYAGRADRYFVNNEGVRFDPGIVETEMSRQPAIHQCAVVPVLDKRIHDTVPVLYVVMASKGKDSVEAVRTALIDVFLREGRIKESNLPSQFILVDEIPCNANGKLDIYRITRERLTGTAYNIVPVREEGAVTDIRVEFAPHLDSIRGGTLPEGMGNGSALGLYDLFNQSTKTKKSGAFSLLALTKQIMKTRQER